MAHSFITFVGINSNGLFIKIYLTIEHDVEHLLVSQHVKISHQPLMSLRAPH